MICSTSLSSEAVIFLWSSILDAQSKWVFATAEISLRLFSSSSLSICFSKASIFSWYATLLLLDSDIDLLSSLILDWSLDTIFLIDGDIVVSSPKSIE